MDLVLIDFGVIIKSFRLQSPMTYELPISPVMDLMVMPRNKFLHTSKTVNNVFVSPTLTVTSKT